MLKNKFEQHNLYRRGGIHKCLCGFVGGVAKCPCLSTRGEGGVKNGPKSVYVVYGSPLILILKMAAMKYNDPRFFWVIPWTKSSLAFMVISLQRVGIITNKMYNINGENQWNWITLYMVTIVFSISLNLLTSVKILKYRNNQLHEKMFPLICKKYQILAPHLYS